MSAADVIRSIAETLEVTAESESDGTWTLPVTLSDDLVDGGEADAILVSLYTESIDWGPALGAEVLLARATVGELDESDPLGILHEGGASWFARLYVDEESRLISEAALPLTAPQDCLVQMIQEVADLCGALLRDDD